MSNQTTTFFVFLCDVCVLYGLPMLLTTSKCLYLTYFEGWRHKQCHRFIAHKLLDYFHAFCFSISYDCDFSFVRCLGLVLKANKRYSQRVTKAFHVAQATLDINTIGDEKSVVQVWVTIDEAEHLIANLSGRTSHVTMDVTFTEGESVAFYSKGTGTVHLTGYLLPEDDFGMGDEEEEDGER